jgi:prephenate dehydrogenase
MRGLCGTVVGVSRHKASIARAQKIGVIDQGSCNISVISGADLVIVATPVQTIMSLAANIRQHVAKDCLVTDVGSAKQEIVACYEKIFSSYVGSHPMAGSEQRGVDNAAGDLFQDSLCIVTPTRRTPKKAEQIVTELWRALGAGVVIMRPAVHDAAVSAVSHLPHAVAFSLIKSVPEQYLRLAATGLRDTTRVAASDAGLWADIFLSNSKNVVADIVRFQKQLDLIKTAIKSKNRTALERNLEKARRARERLA